MTRKKFIKHLMAHGVPRDAAATLADKYNRAGWPYIEAVYDGICRVFLDNPVVKKIGRQTAKEMVVKFHCPDGYRACFITIDEVHEYPAYAGPRMITSKGKERDNAQN